MDAERNDPWSVSPLNPDSTISLGDLNDFSQRIGKVVTRVLIALAVFGVAFSLFAPSLPPLGFMDVRAVLLAIILLIAGIYDLQTGRVPPEITYPLMGAAIVRALVLKDPVFLLAWGMLIVIYLLHILGGGDSKLLMGLFGLFPFVSFYYAFAIFWVITHYPLMVYWRLRTADGRNRFKHLALFLILQPIHCIAGQMTRERVLHLPQELRETWPSNDDLSRRGLRMAITISLGGILYLALMTPAGLNWQLPF